MGRSLKVLVFLAVLAAGCGGGSSGTIAAPSLADIRAALAANNAYGIVPGLALGEILLPVCTKEDGSAIDFNVTYAVGNLPDWLSFDASSRAVTLSSGSTVPEDAYTAAEVTYSCTDDSDSTVTASQTFTINDLDGGGVVDGKEYVYGEVPLLVASGSWIYLNPGNLTLYRSGTDSFKVPTAVIKVSSGMDPTDPSDDTEDFDGDGLSNLEEVSNGTNIFVAAGDGTFTAASGSPINVGGIPESIAICDFNNDGNMDFAIPKDGTYDVSIKLGNGDGTFADASGSPIAVGEYPVFPGVGDLNSDGNTDLMVTNLDTQNMYVLLGNGDGTFAQASGCPIVFGGDVNQIAVGDFNADSKLDIAAVNSTLNNVSILLGEGDGTFTAASESPKSAGDGPVSVVTGDFNADGVLDLAILNSTSEYILIWDGDGDGTFTQTSIVNVGNSPAYMAVGDFDGDHVLDLATTNRTDGTVSIMMGIGDGSFTEASGSPVTVEVAPRGIGIGDLDGDGNLDFATANSGSNDISVMLGDGEGTFTQAPESPIAAGDTAYKIGIGDLNGDGKLDLIVGNRSDSTVSILLGD